MSANKSSVKRSASVTLVAGRQPAWQSHGQVAQTAARFDGWLQCQFERFPTYVGNTIRVIMQTPLPAGLILRLTRRPESEGEAG
jgi:hypothetical protein